jgi:hypothetical protein
MRLVGFLGGLASIMNRLRSTSSGATHQVGTVRVSHRDHCGLPPSPYLSGFDQGQPNTVHAWVGGNGERS